MTTNLQIGDTFPDFKLPDHGKKPRGLSEFTRSSLLDEKLGCVNCYPLIVVFGRGFFCPRDQQQMRQLVQFQSELTVNYGKLVTVSADPRHSSRCLTCRIGSTVAFLIERKEKGHQAPRSDVQRL